MESVRALPTTAAPSRRIALLTKILDSTGVPAEVVLPDGSAVRCGQGVPAFRVTIHDESALARGLDELAIGAAYVEGKIDFEGDLLRMFDVRAQLVDRTPWLARLGFFRQFLSRRTSMNRKAIGFHYDLGDEFYLSFIDSRWRFYSHGHFLTGTESIEEASERKLETIFDRLHLRPGMRLLDIGAGWGGVPEYCAARGVHVTSLTIAPDSHRYVTGLITAKELSAEVHLQDFLEYRPEKPFDAIVILGVIEHIPDYRRFAQKAWECLAPGGRLYMDASASKEKHNMSAFTRRYIWNGPHTFLAMPEMVQEFLYNGFDVLEVKDESRDYERTMRQWAERYDAARERIVARWGEPLYRAFRIYLWGGCHALGTDRLQAYRIVARRGDGEGLRPGVLRRAKNFAMSLRG